MLLMIMPTMRAMIVPKMTTIPIFVMSVFISSRVLTVMIYAIILGQNVSVHFFISALVNGTGYDQPTKNPQNNIAFICRMRW
jgi:hypothetical protein